MDPDNTINFSIAGSGTCLIFFHLPKTAGGSVKKALIPLFPESNCVKMTWRCWREDREFIKSMPGGERRRLRMISGHQPYGMHRLLEQPSVYLTFLREPVDRSVSHHFWSASRDQLPGEPVETTETFITLAREARDSFVAGRGALQFCNYGNLMTRFLANEVFGEGYASDDEMLEVAIERLTTMKIGLQSEFEESSRRIATWLGAEPDFSFRDKFNPQRPRVSDLPDDVQEFLHQINNSDNRLYEEGVRLFKGQG